MAHSGTTSRAARPPRASSSKVYGRLLEDLCGADSHFKRSPPFIRNRCERQKQLLLDVLPQGDGSDRGT